MAAAELTPTLTVAEHVGDLVRIPSVNPMQAGPKSGDDGERALAAWLAERAADLGAEVTTHDVLDGRENVYAVFPGQTEDVVAVDVHMDTVGVEHMTEDPFDGRIADDRVYGRGSVDTKASLAIVLTVLEELQREGLRPVPTVHVVGTVAEEMGGLLGAAAHADRLRAEGRTIDRMVVAEPTMCAPVHGHKGGVGLEITIHGHACHSSKPHLGKNAVTAAGQVITALAAEHDRLQSAEAPTPVGNGTVAVTMIEGGLARNIIPDRCEVYAGRRVAPGEDPTALFEQLGSIVREAASPLDVEIALANGVAFPAFWQDPDSALVRELCALADTTADVATYGSNALHYGDLVDEMVVFGPGSIDQAHQAVEWIDIAEIARATDIYRRWFRNGL